jgi:2-keto-4-pentenoate hydratase
MTEDALRSLALRLLADHHARTPVDCSVAEAYRLQGEVARLREQRGAKVIGYKIGCASTAVQEQLGVGEPIFGRLFDTGCHRSGVRLSHACYPHLAIEGELAVRLFRDLTGPFVSDKECQEAIDAFFPVIELHHFVLHGAGSPAAELIARNGIHAGFVQADPSCCPSPPDLVPGLTIRIDGVVAGAVEAAAPAAGPVGMLRWLAGRLARFDLNLRRGQIILTGSLLPLYRVGPGSNIVVEAQPLGTVEAEIDP